MAWLFVPGLVDSTWPSGSSSPTIAPSVTSRGKPMPPARWWRAWRTVPWIRRLSGTMCAPFEADAGVDRWISSQPAFRARRGVPPAPAAASRTSAGSGLLSSSVFAKYDPHSSSWKMCLPLFPEADWPSFLAIWPSAGSMRSGICSPPPMSAPRISAPHDDDRRDASGDDADRCDAPMGEPECRRRVLRERCDREPGGLAEFDGPDLADASGVRLQGFEWDGASDGGDGPQASRPAAALRDASLGDAARGGLGVLWESSACDGFADRADAAVEHAAEREHTVARAALAVFPPAPGDAAGWRRVLAVAPELAPALAPHTQSAVRLLVDESSDWVDRALAARVDQLRALGNAVVPVCAAVALYVLAERARLLTKEAEICLGSTAQPS